MLDASLCFKRACVVFLNMSQVTLVLYWVMTFILGGAMNYADLFAMRNSARNVGEV